MQPEAEEELGLINDSDVELEKVVEILTEADPEGERTARVLRYTFDQLYDGQRTGRFRVEQLFKTEKTHFGTLFEINFRREFKDVVSDGVVLDYQIAALDVDCKFSFSFGGWMLPPEAREKLMLVATANDKNAEWALGVVRASEANLRQSSNRDGKTGLNSVGRNAIRWLHFAADLPPNVLLQLQDDEVESIFGQRSGQQRVNQLFRVATNRRVSRNIVATVAQQDDYMKRVRANGGARSDLASEGIIIPGGDYAAHRQIAIQLGCEVPGPGEFVSVRVVQALETDSSWAEIDGNNWRLASEKDPVVVAPKLPSVRNAELPSS